MRRIGRGGRHVKAPQPPAQGHANPPVVTLAYDTLDIATPAIATRIGLVERAGDMVQGALIAQTSQMIDLDLPPIALAQTAMDREPHGLPLMATVADRPLVATPGLGQSALPRATPLRIGVP
ncbi:hypothetical protein AA13755_2242 [Acetobacter peroxydans NBRC 13755]|nr:hypothetical protein AA13755_2242 [Acetobacter peroxydans NBRC 13755]